LAHPPPVLRRHCQAIRAFRMRTQADPQQRQQARRRLVEITAAESRAA
jgi:hypothetical protein